MLIDYGIIQRYQHPVFTLGTLTFRLDTNTVSPLIGTYRCISAFLFLNAVPPPGKHILPTAEQAAEKPDFFLRGTSQMYASSSFQYHFVLGCFRHYRANWFSISQLASKFLIFLFKFFYPLLQFFTPLLPVHSITPLNLLSILAEHFPFVYGIKVSILRQYPRKIAPSDSRRMVLQFYYSVNSDCNRMPILIPSINPALS